MAYSAMTPKSSGDIPDETDWNQIIDNFIAGVPDIFTTKGDLAVASAADTAGRLGVGTNGYALIADSSETLGIKWAALGFAGTAASAKVSSAKALASGSTVIVDFDTAIFDPGSDITTGASWKYTAPETGYYFVQAMATLESSTAWGVNEYFRLDVYKNGTIVANLAIHYMQAAATYLVSINGSAVVSLSATDYIDIRATQNSGSAINIGSDGQQSYVSIARMF